MSIRHSLLALLQDQPRYGYQLRVEFENRTGATWPLNIGQVYTTLDRLERDALVAKEGDDGEGHVVYSITPAGKDEVRNWFAAPVERNSPPRNELAIKLALAVTLPGVDVQAIIQAQRVASIRALQDYTRARRDTAANQLRTSALPAGVMLYTTWPSPSSPSLATRASRSSRSRVVYTCPIFRGQVAPVRFSNSTLSW
jgi:DNA-binding PadR family transcriptional regulator